MLRSVANGDTTCASAPGRQPPGAAARARCSLPLPLIYRRACGHLCALDHLPRA